MTTDDIALVRAHFAALAGQEAAFSAAFYDRLFAGAPELRAQFPQDMAEQARKLMVVLGFAITHLDRPEALAPAVRALGARHAAYGVRPDQFAPVGAALLGTLEDWLGAAFDARARAIWTAVFEALAALMREGMAASGPIHAPRVSAAG